MTQISFGLEWILWRNLVRTIRKELSDNNSKISLKKVYEKFNHCNDFATNLLNNDFNNDFTQTVLLAVNIYVF